MLSPIEAQRDVENLKHLFHLSVFTVNLPNTVAIAVTFLVFVNVLLAPFIPSFCAKCPRGHCRLSREVLKKKKNVYPRACCGSLYKCLLSIIDLTYYNEANNEDNCASAVIIECASQNVAKIASRNRSAANQNKMEIARFI